MGKSVVPTVTKEWGMSRSGYSDYDCEYSEWAMIRWRGAVKSAIKGKRGQAFLKEALDALDKMEAKRLIRSELRDEHGEVCFLGAVGAARGVDMARLDPEDHYTVARVFGIAEAMAQEIMYENDDAEWRSVTPEERYFRMRRWAEAMLSSQTASSPEATE
jgi:hypothetical protein